MHHSRLNINTDNFNIRLVCTKKKKMLYFSLFRSVTPANISLWITKVKSNTWHCLHRFWWAHIPCLAKKMRFWYKWTWIFFFFFTNEPRRYPVGISQYFTAAVTATSQRLFFSLRIEIFSCIPNEGDIYETVVACSSLFCSSGYSVSVHKCTPLRYCHPS